VYGRWRMDGMFESVPRQQSAPYYGIVALR
jgi:hypothetical protein